MVGRWHAIVMIAMIHNVFASGTHGTLLLHHSKASPITEDYYGDEQLVHIGVQEVANNPDEGVDQVMVMQDVKATPYEGAPRDTTRQR